jgi:hypothetical protein
MPASLEAKTTSKENVSLSGKSADKEKPQVQPLGGHINHQSGANNQHERTTNGTPTL